MSTVSTSNYRLAALDILAHSLAAIPHLHPGLVEEKSIDRMLNLAYLFPVSPLAAHLLLESSLTSKERWVDISFEILNRERVQPLEESLAGALCLIGILKNSAPPLDHSLWDQLIVFLKSWPKSPEEFVGLELDNGSALHFPPKPNFFLCAENFDEFQFVKKIKAWHELCSQNLILPFLNELERYEQLCLAEGLYISSCGFMLARSSKGIRVTVRDTKLIEPRYLQHHLYRTGYAYDIQPLIKIYEKMNAFAHVGTVAVDIAEEIMPRIGVSLFANIGDWGKVLSILEELDMIHLQQKEACLAWQGTEYISANDADQVNILVRTISHLKLVYLPSSQIEIKIYLKQGHFKKE